MAIHFSIWRINISVTLSIKRRSQSKRLSRQAQLNLTTLSLVSRARLLCFYCNIFVVGVKSFYYKDKIRPFGSYFAMMVRLYDTVRNNIYGQININTLFNKFIIFKTALFTLFKFAGAKSATRDMFYAVFCQSANLIDFSNIYSP